jgi:YEATS family/TIR domain
MTLRIEQQAEYAGKDHWRWTLRLRGRQAELDRVAKVTWLLHESFTPPIVDCDDRTTRFALQGSGWGGFDVRARVLMKSGRNLQLEHELVLYYPEEPAAEAVPSAASAPAKAVKPSPQKVFLSYGSEDRRRVGELRVLVESLGAVAVDARSRLAAGESWRATIQQALRDSDVVLGVVSSEFPSPFLVEELADAAKLRKPLLLVKAAGVGRVAGLPDDAATHSLLDGDDAALRAALSRLLGVA